jgi:predicted RNA-binding protein with PUA-like domain
MAYWLFKQEPTCYDLAALERDRTTTWDGVKNALALKHLRAVRPKDRVWFYHTGSEKAVVGEMRVVRTGPADPNDPKAVAVEVEFVRRLPRPVTLEMVKKDPVFADWDLIRLPRLSVVPMTAAQWEQVAALGESE